MKVLVVLFFVTCPFLALGQFNMSEYRKMPPLYSFDDFDVCLQTPEMSSYCLVITEIVPNATSSLWNQIANFSADYNRHYQHDNLLFGVCVNECKVLLSQLNPKETEELHSGGLEKNTALVEFYNEINEREAGNRLAYDKLISTCLNHQFRARYGLQLRSFIEYCETNGERKPLDFVEIIFIVTMCALLLLTIACTSYDRQLRNKDSPTLPGNEFYKQRLHTQRDILFTSFSIYRNYYRLVETTRGEISQDLRFFECFRFLGTFMVILAHVLMIEKSIPIRNTEFIERFFHSIGSNIIVNGTLVIQVFFVMSSFLLCIGFQKNMASKNPGFPEWGRIVSYRYLRLTPTLAFMILLNASILPRLQDGPFWRQASDSEHFLCRTTWWHNLLYINNFTLRESCLHQTWYLAADFQLYIIFAAILILIARFPKTRNYILGAGVVISFLTTGLVAFFLELDAFHMEAPDSYRYMYWRHAKTIFQGYVPFYMNFGGFFFGTITGLIYLKYKDEAKDLKKYKTTLNRIIVLCIPILILILLSGEIFYRFEFKKPSIWIGLYAGLLRNIWAILSCGIVLLMSFKLGTILYKFTALKIFVPLGRLSYQVYLVHSIVIRCVIGSIRQPLYANHMTMTIYTLAAVIISVIFGFLLNILLELPILTLVNMATKSKPRKNIANPVVNPVQMIIGPKKEIIDIPVKS